VEYRGTSARAGKRPPGRLPLDRRIRNIRRRIYGWVFRCVYWTLPKLPLWFISLLAKTIVVPAARLRYWRRAQRNLVRVYGDALSTEERRQILTGVFRGVGALVVELTGAMAKHHDFYRSRVEDAGLRGCVRELQERSPKGWIGVCGHLGNWELMAAWASQLPGARSFHVIAKRVPNPYLNAIVEDARLRLGLGTIYRDDPPTKIVRLLKAGNCLGIVPDQDVPALPGMFVDFLGHPAYTPTGPARLALAADVPLIPAALLRKGDGFKVVWDQPIHPDRSRPRKEEVLRLTLAWSKALENMIHAHKDQWAWFHQRWKTTPEKLTARGRTRIE
jgi:KDO2-lipid IV(A) lauroyltransferase